MQRTRLSASARLVVLSALLVPHVGAAAGELHPTRQAIVRAAVAEIGRVEDARGTDGLKKGWQRLVEYHRLSLKSAPSGATLAVLKRVGGRPGAWSGIFAVWAVKKSGMAVEWGPISGGWGPRGLRAARSGAKKAKPGDIIVLRNMVHCILEETQGDSLVVVCGDAERQQVQRKHKKRHEVWYHYRTVEEGASPPSAQTGPGSGTEPGPGAPETGTPATQGPETPSGGGSTPDCSLTGGRTYASVSGLMHKPGTCRSLAAKFSPEASCAVPSGYRRAKNAEVTPPLGRKAVEWLNGTPADGIWLSTYFDDKSVHYRLRTEYHCHNPGEAGPQGWHKGVTVYVALPGTSPAPQGGQTPPAPAPAGASGALRQAILKAAASQIGLVKDARGPDGSKIGWQRLAEYYKVAFRMQTLPPAWLAGIKQVGGHSPGAGSWCGIFAIWATKTGGVDAKWGSLGSVGWGPVGVGKARTDFQNMQPGDILVVHNKWVHHCILEKRDGNKLTTLDGNTSFQQIERTQKDLSQIWYYYRTVDDGAPAPAPTPVVTPGGGDDKTPPTPGGGDPPTHHGAGPAIPGNFANRCPSENVVHGIDVSIYQGDVDWKAVKQAGKAFAFARASLGTSVKDSTFAKNWAGMKAAGLLRGAYHFFHPSVDPVAQANLFASMIQQAGGMSEGDLPPVADVEQFDKLAPAVVAEKVKQFLDAVEKATGRKPMVYSGLFMSSALPQSLSEYPLWVANYGVKCPLLPAAWKGWYFWQHQGTGGRTPGIKADVDQNIFNGTMDELVAFIRGGGSDPSGNKPSAPAPEPQPQPQPQPQPTAGGGRCPPEMTLAGSVCIDRWEAATVEILAGGGEQPHSPYKPVDGLKVRAVSAAGQVPQGYISAVQAREACRNAGKRLCSIDEWVRACKGPDASVSYPYGGKVRKPGYCNEGKDSPVIKLFGNGPNIWDATHMNDARISQQPGTLARAGEFNRCKSPDGAFDMVGNLHEWVEHPRGAFKGGFYADAERNGSGCNYTTTAHVGSYHDYSTGFRCCKDPAP
jgi:GH25 family lysozyme M1 (1,4-beta-N-acetylmuramidase)